MIQIVEATADSKLGYIGYGAARELWGYKGPEVILEGPYQTGKTIACLQKLNALLAKYPKSRALMVRRTYESLRNSAVISYEQKVLPYPPGHPKCAVRQLGKSKPELYIYPNGSTIVLGGLDNPNKFLSAEFDYIYINQAEELLLDHYEKLVGRVTGRAGNAPYPQLIADCNPDVPTHWILARDRLRRFKMRHQDNPTLYDQATGEITDLGRLSMEALHALTGVRRKRGLEGLWVGVEGMVYEGWDRNVHLVDRFEIPRDWRRIRVCDFGYVNPFVCQWWAIDGDLRMYLYRELYMSQRTVATHAAMIKKLSAGEAYEATIADHDAEDRATLRENGIETIPADKRVTVGIEKVQERLVIQGNGKPRLFILRDSLVEKDVSLEVKFKPTNTADEFPAYAWQQAADGKPAKEEPVKVDDHGCLVGDTLIETTEGYKPISKILTGEMVLGREGFVKVTASALTQINAAIWTVVFDNGATLKGTCDHPVWTENGGFVRIDALRYGDIAWYAKDATRRSLLTNTVNSNIALARVVAVFTTNEKAPVYNLTVDGGEYFADSILVHNCDATRYAVMYLDGLGRYAPPGTVKYA